MALRIFDTATPVAAGVRPARAGPVSIYVCGATVQAPPHIGHIRSGVNFDILRRWLTRSGYEVTFIRNVTDIDDKILAKAAEARTAVVGVGGHERERFPQRVRACSAACRRPTSRERPATCRR